MSADHSEVPGGGLPGDGPKGDGQKGDALISGGAKKSDALKKPKKSPKKNANQTGRREPAAGGTGRSGPGLRGNGRREPGPARGTASREPGAGGNGRREPARRPPSRDTSRRRAVRRPGLDTPLDSRRVMRGPVVDSETFGRWSEGFARFMGTAWFLVGMTVFVGGWLAWNSLAPPGLQFDPRPQNFTLMTLILSLQASYAAPLILLAQNRQADRDRVTAEQDRDRAERALADTEYLAREIAALRIALGDVATRDFVRSELRTLLDEATVTRKTPRKPNDSFGSTRETELPTDTG